MPDTLPLPAAGTETGTETLGLFETDAQLEALLAWQREAGTSLRLVALTAAADYAAARRGLTSASAEDFLDEAAVMAEGIALFERLRDFCQWLDRFAAERLGEDMAPWFATFDFAYSLKGSLDRLFYRTILLNRLFTALRPARVIGFSSAISGASAERRQNFPPYRSVAMTVLPAVATAHGIEAILLPASETVAPVPPEMPPPDLWDELLRQVREFRAGTGKDSRLIVLAPYWSAGEVLAEAQRRGMPVVRTNALIGGLPAPSPDEQATYDRLWDDVRLSEPYQRLLTFDGITVAPLGAPTFGTLVRECLPRQRKGIPALADRFRELGDSVLLASSIVHPSTVAIMRAARAAGTPSVVIQHGGMWYFGSITTHFTDPWLPDVYLCYGTGSRDAIRETAGSALPPLERHRARLVPAGCPRSLALAGRAPAPRAPGRGIRVLYLTTSLSGEEYFLGATRHADIWYWRFQRDVVRHCTALAGVELTVRPAPGTGPGDPLHDWLFETRPGCRYAPTGPLDDLLLDADVIAVDYTASTVLLHAVATPAQVVALFRPPPLSILHPTARDALERRAWIADSAEGFLAAVESAVAACRDGQGQRPLDRTFLTLYVGDPAVDPTRTAVDLLATAATHDP